MEEMRFQEILKNFGQFASWAIWGNENQLPRHKFDPAIGFKPSVLKEHIIILGINKSQGDRKGNKDKWHNFHATPSIMDSRLKEAFNKRPFRGAYMTDCETKIVDGNSRNIEIDFSRSSKKLTRQLKALGVAKFYIIPLGNDIFEFVEDYRRHNPKQNICIPCKMVFHPSPRVNQKKWEDGIQNLPDDYRAWRRRG